jgi:hypothetical protein
LVDSKSFAGLLFQHDHLLLPFSFSLFFSHNLDSDQLHDVLTYSIISKAALQTMMFSSKAFRLVLVVAAACNAVTSATEAVDLGDAEDYVILAKSGITNVPTSAITGNIGVSPIAAAAMTGFDLIMDSSDLYSLSTQIDGEAHASDYHEDTGTALTSAIENMMTAYNDAAGRPNEDGDRTNIGGGYLGGDSGGESNPLTPGVYTFGTDVHIDTTLYFGTDETLASDVFIIQMTGNLMQAANVDVILNGGVLAKNIFWQVAGHVEVGKGAHIEGVLLCGTKVDFLNGSSISGRVLAQTACNLGKATITSP